MPFFCHPVSLVLFLLSVFLHASAYESNAGDLQKYHGNSLLRRISFSFPKVKPEPDIPSVSDPDVPANEPSFIVLSDIGPEASEVSNPEDPINIFSTEPVAPTARPTTNNQEDPIEFTTTFPTTPDPSDAVTSAPLAQSTDHELPNIDLPGGNSNAPTSTVGRWNSTMTLFITATGAPTTTATPFMGAGAHIGMELIKVIGLLAVVASFAVLL